MSRRESGAPTASVWRFVLRFAVLWALMLLGLALLPGIYHWGIRSTVASLSWLLRAVAIHTVAEGSAIYAGGAEIEIVPDCTPLMPTLVLWAAIVAFPSDWRRRLLGMLAGAVAVWIFNLMRVLALLAVLVRMPQHFEFVHVYLWQTGTLLVVLAMFVTWVRVQSRVPSPR